ncbi:DUF6118 family protein [Rhizomicrobium electricum]|uniref:Uncharacterized protein n=1 Tax=Rhizomicrobium electricum TaxID=480070 RepID=A0ABN1F6K2_9PROT|nr:DUF6118 family protein [Rhizomicrobium electricum]NIJ50428.1 hypothetical protein [Rhizomicrobium electricum]
MTDGPEVLPNAVTPTPATQEPKASLAEDPAAAAFEALREEVALARRAVAGLAAERATIPDYSETLGQILKACTAAAWHFKKLGELLGLHLTPENIGRQIDDAAESARRANHAVLTGASAALQQATRDLNSYLQSARSAKSQRIWLVATGAACLITGMILWAVIAGLIVQSPPVDHRSPEAKAAAILGMEQTAAGEHLIQASAPALWNDIVLGNRIVVANRHALDACLKSTSKQRKRCVITMPAAER